MESSGERFTMAKIKSAGIFAMMTHFTRWSLALGLAACTGATGMQAAQITIFAAQVTHTNSPYLTGACLEDVNHEMYGGIDSQMIYGESFNEPAPPIPFKGFQTFGGAWSLDGDHLTGDGNDGIKFIADDPGLSDGEVSVDLLFPDTKGGNGGLILKVSQPGTGADKFNGYEVSLDPSGRVILGRHRQNWEPIQSESCIMPINTWIKLTVRLKGHALEVLVNGESKLQYEDNEHPLADGTIGLRTWQRSAQFRHLTVTKNGETKSLPFETVGNSSTDSVSGMWRAFQDGSVSGQFAIDHQNPFSGGQSQRITFSTGNGAIGIANGGLNHWGMNFVRGKTYEGYLYVRAEQPAQVFVGLENHDGTQSYAEESLTIAKSDWQKIDFHLTPAEADANGRFVIKLKQPSSVEVGYAFLQPGKWGRFKGLPVRKDVGEGLVNQGVTVLRLGGCMANAAEYRWKKMIGPRAYRPPYQGWWHPQSSDGWGIFDFLNYCEAAGILGVPDFNINETPQDMADFMEYVNGPADSEWGKRRAADGHPAPYHLKYMELGNEERVDDNYGQKFEALARAIWAKDPDIILVVGDFAYDVPFTDPFHFTGNPDHLTTLEAQQKIMQLAKANNREVWFDVHVNTEGPRPNFGGTFSYIDAMDRLAEGAKHHVVVFELNAGNHAQKRALANAAAIGRIERDGRLPICTSANCLQPDGQNDNDWDQGLLFLNPSQAWLQPPGYITQMIAQHCQPLEVAVDVQDADKDLDVSAQRSADGKKLVVRVVNFSDHEVASTLNLQGFVPAKSSAQWEQMAAPLDAANTAGSPDQVKPSTTQWQHGFKDGQVSATFPASSFTVIQFK